MTLAEFLLARIAEDQAAAEMVRDDWLTKPIVHEGDPGSQPWCLTGTKRGSEAMFVEFSRVLAECEAKRRIVELADEAEHLDNRVWGEWGLPSDPGYNDPRCGELILRALAQPYADHRDYQPEWSVTSPFDRAG